MYSSWLFGVRCNAVVDVVVVVVQKWVRFQESQGPCIGIALHPAPLSLAAVSQMGCTRASHAHLSYIPHIHSSLL